MTTARTASEAMQHLHYQALQSICLWIARCTTVLAVATIGLWLGSSIASVFVAVVALLSMAALMTAVYNFISPTGVPYGERVMVISGLALIAAMLYMSRSPVALVHIVPIVLLIGFTERDNRWRMALLVAGQIMFCYIVWHYAQDVEPELSGSALLFGQVLHTLATIFMIMACIGHFSSMAQSLHSLVARRESALQQRVAEAIQDRAALRTRLLDLERAEEKFTESVAAEQRARAGISARREALEQFAYAASHDLKEPVRTIRSFMQVARKQLPTELASNVELAEYFDQVEGDTTAMHGVLEALLAYSRATRRTQQPRLMGIAEAWQQAVERHKLDGCDTFTVLPHDLQAWTDPLTLTTILDAALCNARKFARADVPLKLEFVALPTDEDGGVLLTVSDNGIGIAEAYRERVFGLFQRLHVRGDYPGAGVGLALVRSLVAGSGGRVSVDEATGGGTSLRVVLPEGEHTKPA